MTRLLKITDRPKLVNAIIETLRMLDGCHPRGKDFGDICSTLAVAIARFEPIARDVFLEYAPDTLRAMVNDQMRQREKLLCN